MVLSLDPESVKYYNVPHRDAVMKEELQGGVFDNTSDTIESLTIEDVQEDANP